MSLEDYINRVPAIPPVVDLNEQQSSLDEDYPPLDPGRTHITNTAASNRPGNSTIPRFSLTYWTALHTDDAVATVLPDGVDRLTLTSEFRTNKDRGGLLWSSKDTLAHQITSYVENINYENMVLAFQHNTDRPDQFTATITNSVGTFIYRLVPYGYNAVTKKYECLDTKYGTGKTYPATVYDNTKPNIAGVSYAGRTDYIFILDFNDLRQGHNYTGSLIDPRKVASISLDVVPAKHGLGINAIVSRVIDLGGGQCRMEIGGVEDTAKLTAGDVITGLMTYVNNSETQITVNTSWTVISSTGFGSSARSVLVQGSMPGGYIDFPVLYARDLQDPSVMQVVNAAHTFGNFKLTGNGVLTMGKRTYVQDVNGLTIASSLDRDHVMQPKCLVDSVVALGYRQDWNLSLGSKAYFQGTTTLQKTGVADVTGSESNQWPVLYAGEAQLNGQFVVGRAPGRGIDKLHDDVTASWDSNFAGILPFNGTSLNSSVEAAGMPVGGSYWWDLELDLPGPAALKAVASMRGRIPKGVVWCLGDSDAVAIDSPGDRMPVPTIARAKEATEALFAYFRSIWGANLPIWIQEQAWGWVGTDPVDPTDPGTNVPIQKGAPTYLRVRRTEYGDLLFEWKSYDLEPSLAQFRVEIYNPLKINEVLHSFVVFGGQEENGYVYADWSIEDNAPIRALVDTGNDVWAGIRWRVVSLSALGVVPSVTKSGLVPIDNTLIERVIVCSPNLYMGNYFTQVSDPTHGFNRRDLQAATIMRKEYASKAGIRRLRVIPLDVSDEDRGDEDTELEDQKFGRILKDWWNLELGFPGPSLVAAIAKVNALGRPVAHFVQGQPGEVELMRTMLPVDILTMLDELRQANVAMLAFLRTVWSKPDLCMWVQGASSIWMGIPGVVPFNINSVATEAMKDSQTQQCLGSPDFFLGSYVPGSDAYQNFQAVGLEYKYPKPDVYYETARQMGESMAVPIDRAVDDPGCPDMVLTVTPQFGDWGTGSYALYAAQNNGKYPMAGTVNIPNNRLAHLLLSTSGPASTEIIMTGVVSPASEDPPVHTLNGVVVEPSSVHNTNALYPAWGPFYYDGTVPEGGLRYSDNTLVFMFDPVGSPYLVESMACRVYDDTTGGQLVYETVLYRAGNTEGLGVFLYTEKKIIDGQLVPPPEYVPAHVNPPFNPATALVGHSLRFELVSQSGVFPYYNSTSVAIWGDEATPVNVIQLAKNGANPVSLTPVFEPMSGLMNEFSGQWRVDLNEQVFPIAPGDTVDVILSGVCDHDTGAGCDNPILIVVGGMEYNVTPTVTTNGSEYFTIWASQESGLWDPRGSISPNDFRGFISESNGLTAGSTVLPHTFIYRWGNGDEGFTNVVINYLGVDHTFPLTWTPTGGGTAPQGNGVWQYGSSLAEIGMSTGAPFTATFHGGIAAERTVEVCSFVCTGCDLEDTYTTSNISYGNGANLISFDYLKQIYESGAFDSLGCVYAKDTLDTYYAEPTGYDSESLGRFVWAGGTVVNQTVNLADTVLIIHSYVGSSGGYAQSFNLVRPDGVMVPAGFITLVRDAFGEIREDHLTIPTFEFGTGPGQYVQLILDVSVSVSGTVYDTTLPPINTMTMTDTECMIGIFIPVCCHYSYPPN